MFLVCSGCGDLSADRPIRRTAPGHAEAVCPTCGHAQPFRLRPLPVVVGASGSGKSTLAARLARSPGDLFVFENDILWGRASTRRGTGTPPSAPPSCGSP